MICCMHDHAESARYSQRNKTGERISADCFHDTGHSYLPEIRMDVYTDNTVHFTSEDKY